MNQTRVISAAVLVLFLGISISAFAQEEHEKKGGGEGKAQQAQHQPQKAQAQSQHTQNAQPQHTEKAQPQRAQQAQPQHTEKAQPQRTQQAQPVAQNRGNNGNHYGRIPDDHYRANFGHGHSFHMIRPQMISGYQRFQYGGYWFGFNQGWPSGWSYDDDVYVEYVGGEYYMYDLRHPGIHITLSLF
jgi:hypothetical protein